MLSSPEKDDFVSTIFLRPKKDGSHRTILNLKQFNEFLEYHHFKMDTLETAISMMKPGCYMASVDLKDAYYMVRIDLSHQKYLKFWFEGQYFQYTCLPNGLASVPRIFTKLLKPVYSALSRGDDENLEENSDVTNKEFKECPENMHGSFASRGDNRFHPYHYHGSKNSKFLGRSLYPKFKKKKEGGEKPQCH